MQRRLADDDEDISKDAQEDQEFRKEEAVLFEKLSSPPVLLTDVSDLIDRQEENAGNVDRDGIRQVPKRSRKE